ncbi:MAG: protein translocase subunit SecD [Alphaproteobacteria bacterium]|nr:protein translocase subunit SecD [Alphaproteobacteria bacterium]
MLFFARWKVWLINAVCALGVLLSIPAFLPRETLGLPGWFPWRHVGLGLDLRGGAYLLLEVDMQAVVRDRLTRIREDVLVKFRGTEIRYSGLAIRGQTVTLQLRDPGQSNEAMRLLRELAQPVSTGALGGSVPDLDVTAAPDGAVTISLSEVALRDKATKTIEQSMEIVRRRLDPDGIKEISIARQGSARILVQQPGVDDLATSKRLLGQTAKMTFHLLDATADCSSGRGPAGVLCLPGTDSRGSREIYPVRQRVEVDGANLTDARAGQNQQTSEWVVNFAFDSIGGRRFAEITRQNVGQPFAIVLDGKVLTAPVIREPITGGRGQISGNFTVASANELAVLLRAGALPAPLAIVEERVVGPDLGADAIRAGVISIIAGAGLVLVFICWTYGLFGSFACIGLAANLALTLAILNLMEATLTLPGMAGVLLTLGLSVDANILINERIREETKLGKTPFAAMEAGFKRAFSTIVDSNLTTLIKMLLLYAFGSGPVKGFAVTITFGIITSMFTATVLVRLMMVTWLRLRKRATLPV